MKADDKALSAINASMEKFKEVYAAEQERAGLKWDDLILRFE